MIPIKRNPELSHVELWTTHLKETYTNMAKAVIVTELH